MDNKNKKYLKSTLFKSTIATTAILTLIVINQSKQKINQINQLKTDITGLQDTLNNKQEEVDKANSEKQEALNSIEELENNYTSLKNQTDEMSKQLENKQKQISLLTEEIIGEKSINIANYILKDDFKRISKHIHPEKGLTLSPTILFSENHRVITSDELVNLSQDKTKYEWQIVDVKGEQILLTFKEYFEKYIKDTDCLIDGKVQYGNEQINKSRIAQTANSNNVYDKGIYADFMYEGTEENNFTDWKSIRFVFEEHQSNWYITAIITNKA